jgi:hypothetical protein
MPQVSEAKGGGPVKKFVYSGLPLAALAGFGLAGWTGNYWWAVAALAFVALDLALAFFFESG